MADLEVGRIGRIMRNRKLRKWLRDANEFRHTVNQGNIRNAFFRVRTMLNEPNFRHILSMPPSRRNEPPPDMPFPHPDIFEQSRVIAENYAVLEPILDNVRSLLSRIDSGLYSATLSRWRQMAPNDGEDTSELGQLVREVDRTIRWLKDLVEVIGRAREVSNLPWVRVTMVPLAETRKARAKAAALPHQPPCVPKSMTPGWTKTLAEDLAKLTELGFIIDTSQNGYLGEGSSGVVYKGWYLPELWGRYGIRCFDRFAVKFSDIEKILEEGINSTDSPYVQTVEATQTEKLVMPLIKHPNVLDTKFIFQFGEPKVVSFTNEPQSNFVSYDRTYIIMELADGGNLPDWMENHRIPVWQAVSIIRDVVRGLMYLHSIGISHHDLYTANVLMFNRGGGWIAKISDFGQAYMKGRCLPENAGPKGRRNRNVWRRGFNYTFTNEDDWKHCIEDDVSRIIDFIDEILESPNFEGPTNQWEEEALQALKDLKNWIRQNNSGNIFIVFNQFRYILDEDQWPVDDEPELRPHGYTDEDVD